MRGEDTYSEAEMVARREAALKRMLATPHRPHKPKKDATLAQLRARAKTNKGI